MPIGYFLDKTQPPTQEDLQAAMGSVYPLWERLLRFIETNYKLPGEMSYGGKNYGWNLWYRKSGKSLLSLYPQEGYVVAQIVLGNAQVAQALALELGETVGTLLRETPQFHDGRWLFIPVRTAQDAEDVKQLLQVKRRPKRVV